MLQQFVLGTLTTLNSVMAPLTGPVNTKPVYPLDLRAAVATELCPTSKQGYLGLQVDLGISRAIQVRVNGEICRTRLGARTIAVAMNLPADLMDDDFVQRLPVGSAYVASGIALATVPNLHERIKITREPNEGDLIPLRIEWLSLTAENVEHPPLRIWFNPSANQQMPWQKIEIGELAALAPGALDVGAAPVPVKAPRRKF